MLATWGRKKQGVKESRSQGVREESRNQGVRESRRHLGLLPTADPAILVTDIPELQKKAAFKSQLG